MTDPIRRARAALASVALVALAGCSAIGNPFEVLSQKKKTPDEFAVLARGELRMPPSLGASVLPEPRPGAPSPLEPDPQREAILALTGSGVAPGAPASVQVSRGEAALLDAANVAAASPDIRVQLARDTTELAATKPFEPPTLWELFGFGSGSGADKATLLDPAAEARRLQTGGQPAPVSRRALEAEAALGAAARTKEAKAAAEAPRGQQPRFSQPIPLDSITEQ